MEMQPTDLSRAIAFHQQGRARDAIPLYQNFLRANRKHAGAANLLAVALMQEGRLEEAADAAEHALRLDQGQASTHYNLGTILQALKQNEKAIRHFEAAIRLNPKDAQAYNNLGVVLKAIECIDDSIEAFRKAINLNSGFAQAYANLASALSHASRYDEAIEAAKKALTIAPGLAEAQLTIGNVLARRGESDAAVHAFDKAVRLQPNRHEAYYDAGNALMSLHLEERAAEYFRQITVLKPDLAAPRFMLAACLHHLGRYGQAVEEAERAIALLKGSPGEVEAEVAAGKYFLQANREEKALIHFERALHLDPASGDAMFNRAKALSFLYREDEALSQLDQAIAQKSASEDMHSLKALTALSAGRFRDGWDLYEMRFSERSKDAMPRRKYSAVNWDGQASHESVLIWGEQGLGDQILHASILSDAVQRAPHIVLEAEPRLIPLFSRSFPQIKVRALTHDLDESGISAQLPIGSLGRFFRQDWNDFSRRAYLTADRARSGKLRQALAADGQCLVGISWRSSNAVASLYKTARLADFNSILQQPGLDFVDLQYGDTSAEIKAVGEETGITVHHVNEIDNKEDIDGLAALIEACDAVVTISNVTAHIAGALGKPVWILIPHGQGRHWYWFKDRTDSPWYPGARIVRQQRGQAWSELVASIAPKIAAFALARKK